MRDGIGKPVFHTAPRARGCDLDPVCELPYRPAADERPQQRPNRCQHLTTRNTVPEILLALTEASTDVKTRLGTASGQHWCAAAVRLQHGVERRMMRCRHAESASLPHHVAREAFYFERTTAGEIVVHRGVHARREAL